MTCNQNCNQGRDCACGGRRKIRIAVSPMLALLLALWIGVVVLGDL